MRNEAFLIFLALLFLGCPTPAEKPINASLEAPFQLKISQSAFVDSENITITFLNVTGDSRCPANVQCIWAGEARVSARVSQNGKSIGENELLLQGGRGFPVNISSYSMTMLDLAPYPTAGTKTNPSNYIATFVLQKRT